MLIVHTYATDCKFSTTKLIIVSRHFSNGKMQKNSRQFRTATRAGNNTMCLKCIVSLEIENE